MAKKNKEKRRPCPFCKELIINGAKKCRFCGEMIEASSKKSQKKGLLKREISVKLFYWVWLITCAIFLFSIKLFDTANSQFISSQIYKYIQTIFVLAIFIGGGAFIGLVMAILFSLKKKKTKWYGLLTIGTLILFFLIFLNHITNVESVIDKDPLGPVEVVKAINKERESRGLKALTTETQLDSAAKAYAQDMCNKNYYVVSDEDNEKYLEFVDDTGYQYNIVAYIVSEGKYDTKNLTEEWIGDPQIKEIVLSDRYSATGVGIVRCGLEVLGKTTDIIVQFFAEPKLIEVNNQSIKKQSTSDLIECTGPDGKVFKTTQQECDNFNTAWNNPPTPDPNEIIRCNISPNCGGGYKEMIRSSCDRLTCCQINDSWELRDKDQCDKEQTKEANDEWIDFCNNVYDPDDCSTYWESGTTKWYDCRSEAYDLRISCYNNNN